MQENQPPPDDATVRVRHGAAGRAVVVELHGDIDIVSAPGVATVLDRLTAGLRPVLLLDLRSVTFIDCAGLAVLCRTRSRVRRRRGRLALVIDDPRVLQTLSLAGLSRAFEIHRRLPGVLARPRAAVNGSPLPPTPSSS